MIRTKNVISDISDIPITWVYEFYLGLQPLNGQDINIKSIFNPNDSRPSMYIFFSVSENKYYWRDFSTGKSGDGVELVRCLTNVDTRGNAAANMIKDYNEYLINNTVNHREYTKIQIRYKLVDFQTRLWTTDDQKYWTQYKISSKELEHYCVHPLRQFTIQRGTDRPLIIKKRCLYGYFKKDGTLYKIYQPDDPLHKFFKVCTHIQGFEQLTFKKPFLIWQSSLKDILAFNKLGFKNIECVAPDSENVLLSVDDVNVQKSKYKGICSIFDNDDGGRFALDSVKSVYNIPGFQCPFEKDIADSVKIHGIASTREFVHNLIIKSLKEYDNNLFVNRQ